MKQLMQGPETELKKTQQTLSTLLCFGLVKAHPTAHVVGIEPILTPTEINFLIMAPPYINDENLLIASEALV